MKSRNIETTDWLIRGVSEEQLKTEKALAVIAAKIYTKRTQLNMDQKAFAKHMGVSQGLISRWESGTYNFTISTLIHVCEKLGLSFVPVILEKNNIASKIIYVSKKNDDCSQGWDNWSPNAKKEPSEGVA